MNSHDRALSRRYSRKYYEAKRAAGICVRCCHAPAIPGRSKCETCAEITREQARLRMRRYRKAWRALGSCVVCGQRLPIEGQSWCAVCAERTAEYKQKARMAA